MKIGNFKSIQTKLLLISVSVTATVLLFMSFLYVYKHYSHSQEELKASMIRVATLVGDNSIASILFDDKDSAADVLKTLASQKNILTAGLLDANGKLFATFQPQQAPAHKQAPAHTKRLLKRLTHEILSDQAISYKYVKDYFALAKKVSYQNKQAGIIYLIYDNSKRWLELKHDILLTMGVLVFSILLTFIIFRFAQRALVKPLVNLATVMKTVSQDKDYSAQIENTNRKDEIGLLIEGFNDMLYQISKRDKALSAKSKELQHIAYHDHLTDLPNFLLFKEVVRSVINDRAKPEFAIVFLDLDNFKQINDNYGHNVGDKVLQALAIKLNAVLRAEDYSTATFVEDGAESLARIGGDEFIVLLKGCGNKSLITTIMSRIFEELQKPIIAGDNTFLVEMSAGISIYPQDSRDIDELIKFADAAMYQAKETGKNHYQFFSRIQHLDSQNRYLIEQELKTAIEQEQFVLYYQPKVNLENEQIEGYEALIRWQHPQRGLIMPDQFIAIAEKTRLIIPLGEWIIDQCCKQINLWRQTDGQKISIVVNISPLQFKDQNLIPTFEQAIKKYQIEKGLLELEITENVLMEDYEFSKISKDELARLGVLLAIDDFGTGYSSLRYLSLSNAHSLKIDRAFIKDVIENSDSKNIVHSIIGLAHSMSMKVTAEGVETYEQAAYLRSIGCDYAQGYYFGRPLPLNDRAKS